MSSPRPTNTTSSSTENPMSTDVVATHKSGGLPALNFTPENVATIRDQICKPKNRDASDSELALFLSRCQRTGLDPLAGQIVAVFRNDKNAGTEKMSMQVTVEGQRAIANATGEYIGSDREWCASDGQWVDVWLDQENPPAAARVTVRRLREGNTLVEQRAVVAWHEADGHTSKYPSPFWKSQPAHMLAKTAEARALKIAFPGEIASAQETVTAEPPAPRGDQAAPADLPDWALEPTAEQWKHAGQTWFELANQLNVGREATEDSWRTMFRSFGNRKTLGMAMALADGLAELILNIPKMPEAQAPVEGSATEEPS